MITEKLLLGLIISFNLIYSAGNKEMDIIRLLTIILSMIVLFMLI